MSGSQGIPEGVHGCFMTSDNKFKATEHSNSFIKKISTTPICQKYRHVQVLEKCDKTLKWVGEER